MFQSAYWPYCCGDGNKTYQLDFHGNLANKEPWQSDTTHTGLSDLHFERSENLQNWHAHSKPEILLSGDMGSTKIPCLGFRDIKVSENDKCPCIATISLWEGNHRICSVQVQKRAIQPIKRWWRSKTLEIDVISVFLIMNIKTYLWWVFLTQGIAAMELRMIATSVTKPSVRTAGCVMSTFLKLLTTLNISQAIPESAQPLWIPPRCWSADVIPRRNQRGGHCWVKVFLSILVSWAKRRQRTLAKNVLKNRYNRRPNTSFLIKTEKFKFATAMLPA